MAQPEIALLLELVLDLKKDITALKSDSVTNTTNLAEHMRRTELAEARIAKLEARDQMLNGFVKISLALLSIAATAIGIVEAIRHYL